MQMLQDMKILTTLIIILTANFCLAQKPPLAISTAMEYPKIGLQKISNNGKYFSYVEFDSLKNKKLVIQSTDFSQKWTKTSGKFQAVTFTDDSKYLMYLKGMDSSK